MKKYNFEKLQKEIEKEVCLEIIERSLSQNKTILYIAAKYANFQICQLVIQKGVDVNKGKTKCYYIGEGQETPLYIAAKKGFGQICKLLIQNGANISEGKYEHFFKFYKTPIYIGIKKNEFEICKILVENGAHFKNQISHTRFKITAIFKLNFKH
eukprot:TRINITY_DN1648_c2_g1_i2.p1 TRINITY_DN1648_c2_g1~~TRINITY_DN1648_c2_g1_i2.p1  ORF type:complete len:155 (-),score=38.26 TRINITY_DN1648_c2_g1_i2:38-502(-)